MEEIAVSGPVPEAPPAEPLLTRREVARMLRITPNCLSAWHRQGKAPPGIRLSARKIVWRPEAVRGWLARREGGVSDDA
jgi:predicted DNA-binding transcriptional regulator AlpA